MQLLFLDGQFMGFKDYWSFRVNMCYVSRYEWIIKPTIQPKFKSYIHDRCYFLTHKAAGLSVDKIYSEHYVPMTQLQRKAFEGMAKDYQVNGKSTKWATVAAMWLSQISGGYFNGKELSKNKVRALGRLLTCEHVSHSVVVWFRFIEEIKQASAYLKMLGISYGVIHGTVDMDTRDRLVQNFQRGRIRVLLIQEKTGLFSLNLSKASTMIFYSNELSCEVRAQCEDRIVHPTKSEPLFYIDMITEGSSDEEAVEGLKAKKLSASILCQKFGKRFYK